MVLEMLKGQESITSLCHQHGVAMSQAYRWRDAFLERGKEGLRDRRNPKQRDQVALPIVRANHIVLSSPTREG